MQPYIWGKYLWTSIHYISLGYPENPSKEEQNDYKEFFENLFRVIPCYTCSENYKDHLQKLPITPQVLQNTKSLFKWTVEVHNLVNKSLNKRLLSYEEAYQLYTKVHEKNNQFMIDCFSNLSNKNTSKLMISNTWMIFLNFILIIIVVVLLFMRKSFRRLF
mgnify:FL=1